jgi:small subunit ribosomal protein S8
MSMQDPLADMLTRIRNALQAKHSRVALPSSKLKVAVAKVLIEEGYLLAYRVEGDEKPTLVIDLKYYQNKPVIENVKRVSRPGLRIYRGCEDMPQSLGGLGVVVVSTSKGVMSDRKARELRVGGEVLCLVW